MDSLIRRRMELLGEGEAQREYIFQYGDTALSGDYGFYTSGDVTFTNGMLRLYRSSYSSWAFFNIGKASGSSYAKFDMSGHKKLCFEMGTVNYIVVGYGTTAMTASNVTKPSVYQEPSSNTLVEFDISGLSTTQRYICASCAKLATRSNAYIKNIWFE